MTITNNKTPPRCYHIKDIGFDSAPYASYNVGIYLDMEHHGLFGSRVCFTSPFTTREVILDIAANVNSSKGKKKIIRYVARYLDGEYSSRYGFSGPTKLGHKKLKQKVARVDAPRRAGLHRRTFGF